MRDSNPSMCSISGIHHMAWYHACTKWGGMIDDDRENPPGLRIPCGKLARQHDIQRIWIEAEDNIS